MRRSKDDRTFMALAPRRLRHESGDRQADIATVTDSIQAALDGFIRDWPDQWMWAHRRWG